MLSFLLALRGWHEVTCKSGSFPNLNTENIIISSKTKRFYFFDKITSADMDTCTVKPLNIINSQRYTKNKNENNYVVHTIINWIPKIEIKYQKLTKNFYFLENVTLNQYNFLKKDPEIFSIDSAPQINFGTRFSAGYLINGSTDIVFKNKYLQTPREFNLQGSGEVVGIADSGLDWRSPFFIGDSDVIQNQINTSQRKVVLYDAWKDEYDDSPGHGTHTSAIIAGKAECGNLLRNYDGIAPEAKLFFLDLGVTGQEGIYDSFDKEKFAKNLRSVGGGIASNSWGTREISEYMLLTQLYDNVAFENDDILLLFAAGNHYDMITLDSPSTSKNVLCVGALEGVPGNTLPESNIISATDGKTSVDVSEVSFAQRLWPAMQSEEPLYELTKSEAPICKDCQCLQQKKSTSKIMFIDSKAGDCPSIDKTVLRTSQIEEIEKMEKVTLVVSPTSSTYPEKRAEFSSGGPSNNGLSKPDVVAPGVVYSAVSFSKSTEKRPCNDLSLKRFQGTSEATPMVAGVAALIREKARKNNINATSSMIRAALINSASRSTPNYEIGFGAVNAEKAVASKLQEQTVEPNSHYISEFKIQENAEDVTVTVSWLDKPVSETANYPILADIDLVLEGNAFVYADYKYSTNKKVTSPVSGAKTMKLHIITGDFEENVRVGIASLGIVELKFEKTSQCLNDKGECQKGVLNCPIDLTGVACQKKVPAVSQGVTKKLSTSVASRDVLRFELVRSTHNKVRVATECTRENPYIIAGWFGDERSLNDADFHVSVDCIGTIESIFADDSNSSIVTLSVLNIGKFSTVGITVDEYDGSALRPTPSSSPSMSPLPSFPPERTLFPTRPPTHDESRSKLNYPVFVAAGWSTIALLVVITVCIVVFIIISKRKRYNNDRTEIAHLT